MRECLVQVGGSGGGGGWIAIENESRCQVVMSKTMGF